MADNVLVPGAGAATAATDQVTHSGDVGVHVQLFRQVHVIGAEGSKTVLDTRAATATLTNVAGSATSVTIKASNTSRLAIVIVNDSTAILYLKYGATASSTSFTYKLEAGETLRESTYTGIIDGIWASATGSARVTELTP